MSYDKNHEEIEQIWLNTQKTQEMISDLLLNFKKNGIKIQKEDIFLLKELKNKFMLDYNLLLVLLNTNVMNYSLYIKSLYKNNMLIKEMIKTTLSD